MSLFSTRPPRDLSTHADRPLKQVAVPAWVLFVLVGVFALLAAFEAGLLHERWSFERKVDRIYQIKSALGPNAAEQYLKDHP